MAELNRKGVIYGRYSTDMQNATSIDDQVRNVRRLLQTKGIADATFEVIGDHAMSGTDESRPEYQRLLGMIASSQISVLAVDEMSRLTRGSNGYSIIKDVTARGGRFLSLQESIDTSISNWETNAGIGQLKSIMELAAIGQRVRRGLEGKATNPERATGDWCYGYRTEPIEADWAQRLLRKETINHRYIVEDEEAKWVRKAFELFDGDMSVADIVRKFTQEGAPKSTKSRGVKQWHYFTVDKMLRNQKYIGEWPWGLRTIKKDSTGKGHTAPTDPSQHVHTARPELRLIEQELFDRVQEKLRKRAIPYAGKKGKHPRHKNPKQPLAGILTCAVCGKPMRSVYMSDERVRYFRCGRRDSGACTFKRTLACDDVVQEVVKGVAKVCGPDAEWIQQYVDSSAAASKAELDRQPQALIQAQAEVTKKEAVVQNLLDLVMEHGRKGLAGERYGEAEASLEAAKAEVNRLTRLGASRDRSPLTREEILSKLQASLDRIAKGGSEACTALHPIIEYARVVPLAAAPGMKYSGAELRFRVKPLAALSAMGMDVPSGMELPAQNEIVVSLDPPTRSRAVLDRVQEMRAAGKLWKEICKEVGLTYRTLSLRMKEAKDAAAKVATPVQPTETVTAAEPEAA